MDQSVLGAGTLDGDDLLMASPVVGDRNPAAESRQFLLEAVLCTGSHLVVIRDGRDVRTNHAVPPAVALAELRAAVQHTVSAAVVDPADDADPLRPAASPEEVLHPRQAFSERCLAPGRLVTGTVWSFDPAARDAALARRRRAARFTTFAESPLARPDDAVIALDDLRSVLRRPIATFLADVLDLRLPRRSDALDGVLPTAIDSLDRYGVATALVDALDRAGIVPHDEAGAAEVVERWQRRERRLGRVPVTGLSRSDMAALAEEVRTARSSADDLGYRPWTEGSPEVVDADVVVDGTRIVGELRCDLVDGRPGPASLRMSRQKDTDRIAGWIDLLVLHAVDPSRPWRWVAVRRGSGGGKKRRPSKSSSKSPGPSVVELELAPSAPSPEEALSVVVDLYHRARREPLPIFADLSPALAQGAADLATAWPGRFPDPAETAVYGDLDVWDLLGLPTLARDGVPLDAGRARHYAQRLWGTLRLCTRDVGADEADRWDGSTHGDGGGDG
jgi:exodeoxyribonuclease V gamma subunit